MLSICCIIRLWSQVPKTVLLTLNRVGKNASTGKIKVNNYQIYLVNRIMYSRFSCEHGLRQKGQTLLSPDWTDPCHWWALLNMV
jgi:hypothetical protein